MHGRDPEDRPPSVTVGVGRAILSNRISHFLDIRGPRYDFTTVKYTEVILIMAIFQLHHRHSVLWQLGRGRRGLPVPEHT
jgi:acyl transferase domain-containing protein